jgi:probable addiction module antidote protein
VRPQLHTRRWPTSPINWKAHRVAKFIGEVEVSLGGAFATNDLRRICNAVDVAVVRCGISDVARDAELDRTTLYRAFRLKKGPGLDRMITVLRVLGFRLIVETRDQSGFQSANPSRHAPHARATARLLTAAFKTGDLDLVNEAFAKTLSSQENVSELARRTIRSREALYRAFAFHHIPRFSTVLSFLNALEIQFGVKQLRSKSQNWNYGAAIARSIRNPKIVTSSALT